MRHRHLLKNTLNLKKALEQAEALKKISEKNTKWKSRRMKKSTEAFLAKDINSALVKAINVIGSKSKVKFLSNIGDMTKVKKSDNSIVYGFLANDDNGNWIRLNSENGNLDSFNITSVELWVNNDEKRFGNTVPADVKIDLRGENINSIVDICASWFTGETTKNELVAESNENIVTDDEELEKGTEAKADIKFNDEEMSFKTGKDAAIYLMQNGISSNDVKNYIEISPIYLRKAIAEVDGGAIEVIPVPDVAVVSAATAGAKGADVALNNIVSKFSNIETVYKDYDIANKLLIRDLILYQDKVDDWLNTPLTEENIKKINAEVMNRGTKLFLLTGNPGTGKTFTLVQALENMKYDNEGNRLIWDPENPYKYEDMPLTQAIKKMNKNIDYHVSPKSISPSALVDELFLKNGSLYLLDDADGVLSDKETRNFLKGVLSDDGETGRSSRSTYDSKSLVVDVNLQELSEASIDTKLNKNERARAYKIYSIWEDIQNNGWLTDEQWNAILNGDVLNLTHNQMVDIYEDPDLAQVIVGEKLKNSKPLTWNYFGCMVIMSNMTPQQFLKDNDLSAIYDRAGTKMDITLSTEDIIKRMLQIFPSIVMKLDNEESIKVARKVYEWFKDESDTGWLKMLSKTEKQVNTQISLRLFGKYINQAIQSLVVANEHKSWEEWQGYALRNV